MARLRAKVEEQAVRIYANNRGVHLHRKRDGFEETLVADAPHPTPITEGRLRVELPGVEFA